MNRHWKHFTNSWTGFPTRLHPIRRAFGCILLFLCIGSFGFFPGCGPDKAKGNAKRSEECRRLLFLALTKENIPDLTPEEEALLANPDLRLSYSCSSSDGRSPSCREFYTLDPETSFLVEFCPLGFRKSRARCSRQNLVGDCFLFQVELSRRERRVYARPNDDPQSARNDCLLSRGKYQDQVGADLTIPILTACGLGTLE